MLPDLPYEQSQKALVCVVCLAVSEDYVQTSKSSESKLHVTCCQFLPHHGTPHQTTPNIIMNSLQVTGPQTNQTLPKPDSTKQPDHTKPNTTKTRLNQATRPPPQCKSGDGLLANSWVIQSRQKAICTSRGVSFHQTTAHHTTPSTLTKSLGGTGPQTKHDQNQSQPKSNSTKSKLNQATRPHQTKPNHTILVVTSPRKSPHGKFLPNSTNTNTNQYGTPHRGKVIAK